MHLQKGIILISILVLILSCTKIDSGFNNQKSTSPGKPVKISKEQQQLQLEKMRLEAQTLLDSLRIQEKMLLKKEARLDSMQYVMKMREIMLNEKESTLKIMRLTAFIILFVGLVLTVTGIILLLKVRKKPEAAEMQETDTIIPEAVVNVTEITTENVAKEQPITNNPAPVKVQPEETTTVSSAKSTVKKGAPKQKKPSTSKKQPTKPAQTKAQTAKPKLKEPVKTEKRQGTVEPGAKKTAPKPKQQITKPVATENKEKLPVKTKAKQAGNKKQD